MKNIIFALLILPIVIIAGCVGQDKESIIQNVKEKYDPVQSYVCEGFVKCVGSECEKVSEWIKAKWGVEKPDKIRIDKEIPLNLGASYPITLIVNENVEYEISRTSSLGVEGRSASKTIFPNKQALATIISTQGIIDVINFIFNNPELLSVIDIRLDEFEFPPYIESTDAIIVEHSKGAGADVLPLVLDADSLLPLKTPWGIFTNCKLNEPIADSDFELSENVNLYLIDDYTKRCTNDQDCDDGNTESQDTCQGAGSSSPYCSFGYS